jgi:PAS domain S-box-containing protein
MEDSSKTRGQLLQELAELRRKVTEWDAARTMPGEMGEEFRERGRLLSAFHGIGRAMLSSMDLHEVLGILARKIVTFGIFRSLSVSLVDEERHRIDEVLRLGTDGETVSLRDGPRSGYSLDDKDILADVVRAGALQVATPQDPRLAPAARDGRYAGHLLYFIPVKQEQRVVAVLASGSLAEEKEAMLHRIDLMQPLLDQVAIAIDHAQMYEAIQREVTERREAEIRLQTSERRYRELFDNMTSGCGIWRVVTSEDGPQKVILTDYNHTGEMMDGVRREDLVGKSIDDLFPDAVARSNATKVMLQVWETGNSRKFPRMSYNVEGREVWRDNLVYRLPNGELVVIFDDVTERKQMEEELVRTQRLRASAELSAGVSHNLNNILTGILVPAQLLKLAADDPAVLREADEIITYGQRASDLVHRLHLSVSGIEEGEIGPVSVNEVIQEAIQTSRPRWKDEPESKGVGIDVGTQLGEIPPVAATRSRLHDVLTNLIFNAVDAMPEGGAITIETQQVDACVQLVFGDTGIGMDAETRKRLFEPFFTTKMDLGTGLGLSTVYNTVKQWDGTIDVASAPGKGTTFTLCLPVWVPTEIAEPVGNRIAPVRRGRLLVVDDDRGICAMLSRLLDSEHDVRTSTQGRQALDAFVSGTCDVVLIDLGMSGSSGDQIAKELRQKDPFVSLVLITGWELDRGDHRRRPFDFGIAKPFDDLDKIRSIVAQAIELRDERVGKGI